MSRMKQSLEPTDFSTRLRNSLLTMRSRDEDFTLEGVSKLYWENPEDLTNEFLRIPGAGRATLNELISYLDKYAYGRDTIGRIFTMHRDDARENISAIDRLLTHVDANSADYQRLRDVQEALRSSTVIIEQAEDTRKQFQQAN